MGKRLIIVFLGLACVVHAQRRVDPKNSYVRVIGVVSMAGKGTADDPRRPQYASWPPSQDANGIIGFFFQPSDDGQYAVVEFVGRTRAAFQALGRTTYRGPGFAQTDLSLAKSFRLTERVRANLSGDAFNAFNRVNLNNPVLDLSNANFGI